MMRTKWVTRRAKLLEAGVYLDKGVVLTPAHLQRIADTFRAPVPIFVEHCPSPVLLGWVQSVWLEGDSLYGVLKLFPEADALLRRLRVRGLSVGLSPDLQHLREVSVTGNPRVASAQLFARPKEAESMTEFTSEKRWEEASSEVSMSERIRELEHRLRQFEAKSVVDRWVAEGRITPAQSEIAEAILMSDTATINFDDESISVSALFRRFVESLPTREWLAETAPVPAESTPDLSMEEFTFLRQVFPDLNPAEILRQKEVR